jgi:hypothetical protein
MSEKYYSSIDEMPLYNWDKCLAGEVRYVRLDCQEDTDNEKRFITVYDDYLKQRGLDKTTDLLFKAMKRKALLECDYLMTKDRFLLTMIELEEARITKMMQPVKGVETQNVLVALSKWLGFRLNSKEITVSEYFAYLDEYVKQN